MQLVQPELLALRVLQEMQVQMVLEEPVEHRVQQAQLVLKELQEILAPTGLVVQAVLLVRKVLKVRQVMLEILAPTGLVVQAVLLVRKVLKVRQVMQVIQERMEPVALEARRAVLVILAPKGLQEMQARMVPEVPVGLVVLRVQEEVELQLHPEATPVQVELLVHRVVVRVPQLVARALWARPVAPVVFQVEELAARAVTDHSAITYVAPAAEEVAAEEAAQPVPQEVQELLV